MKAGRKRIRHHDQATAVALRTGPFGRHLGSPHLEPFGTQSAAPTLVPSTVATAHLPAGDVRLLLPRRRRVSLGHFQ